MKIYNSKTRAKEEFVPIEEGKVKMYMCGPTVYDYFHIGNARAFTIFDAFRRYLIYKGYEVTYVQNFTDIDDKIIQKSIEEDVDSLEISEKYIKEYFKDADALGIKRADVHPKVTENVQQIIAFIQGLIEKGHAYDVDGDVYFDTASFPNYGKLSNQNIEDLDFGSRIDVDKKKKNPMDFVLWKNKKEGEPYWVSPWGEGRPGWHIECSVMSRRYLADTIDIHAGGQDLLFPHHENEVAQTEAYTGKPYVNYWMHNGYINIENKKMSKSLGNFFTVRDILEQFDAEVVRYFILSAHYRSPVNFSKDLIESAENALDRLYNFKENMNHYLTNNEVIEMTEEENKMLDQVQSYKGKFIKALDDDFNTADGISAIFELVKFGNISINEHSSKAFVEKILDLFKEMTQVFGIVIKEEEALDSAIEDLIEKRQEARKNKDFALADQIRDELKAQGIVLEDTPQGVKWQRLKED